MRVFMLLGGHRNPPELAGMFNLPSWSEHRVMLGPRRVIEHAWQLGWVPVPTQQAKYSNILILSIYEHLFNSGLYVKLSFSYFTMLHD